MNRNNDNENQRREQLTEPLLNGDNRERNRNGHANQNGLSSSSKSSSSSTLPSLWQFISLGKPEFPVLFVAVLFMIVNQVTQLINPKLLGYAYDALVDPQLDDDDKWTKISHTMITVLILHGCGSVAGFLRRALMTIVGERIVSRLRLTLYEKMLYQEISFFDERKTGDLVSMLGSDATVVKQAISQSWAEVLISLGRLIAAIWLMFQISSQLALVSLGTCFVIFVVCLPFGKALGKLSKEYQEMLGAAQNYPTESIGAIRTVQSFAAEQREANRYQSKIGEPSWWPFWQGQSSTYSIGYSKSIVSSAFFTFIFGAGFGAMYVSLWYGFKLVNDGSVTVGELTAFQSYIFLIGGSLAQASGCISQLIEARGASVRIFELLNRQPKMATSSSSLPSSSSSSETATETTSTVDSTSSNSERHDYNGDIETAANTASSSPSSNAGCIRQGSIKFDNVSFAYPSRPEMKVLKGFTLDIRPNTTTALVGSSGAGKSTVVALLQRFYDITAGSISIDGMDIRDMDLASMRKNMGLVQQEPQLFGMTVRENVTYGMDGPVDDEEIYEVCKKANAYDFVMDWPEGFDTTVGERGVKLSGGQKQRLAIARSMLIHPKILLLDEATSALDAESEHLVQQAIDVASEGRTVVVVAHRLSTIQHADQIVVMDGGVDNGGGACIKDIGTHEELLQRCEIYQNLIKRQSSSSSANN